MEPWIITFTGKQFFPFAPRTQDVDIIDIAHGLSMTCRFQRSTNELYSVAQHSVLVARAAEPRDRLRALLHDAHEYYSPFGDVARPLKNHPEAQIIRIVEDRIDRVIAEHFGLPYPIKTPDIDLIDSRIMLDEAEQFMPPTPLMQMPDVEPLGVELEAWSPMMARDRFIRAYHTYVDFHIALNGDAA